MRVDFDESFEKSGIEVLPTLKKVIQFNGIEDWNKTAELHSNPIGAEASENSPEEGGNLPAWKGKGELRGKLCGKLGQLLDDITGGKVRSLDDLGIVPNPRFVLLSGPLRLRLDGQWLDLGRLHGSFRLAQEDIERAEEIATTTRRCLTVENETSFMNSLSFDQANCSFKPAIQAQAR